MSDYVASPEIKEQQTLLTVLKNEKGYVYEGLITLGIFVFFIFFLTYPNIVNSDTKLGSKYTSINIVWIIIAIGFMMGIYPYIIRPLLIPDRKKCPQCPSCDFSNSPNIPNIKDISNNPPTSNLLPEYLQPFSQNNPNFNYNQYARTNDKDTRQLDITIIISRPKPVSKLEKWYNHFSSSEIAVYDYIGKKISLRQEKVDVTSEHPLFPKKNLYDNDLDTYYFTNTTDPYQDGKIQEIKLFIGQDVGISRIIIVNKEQKEILTGMQIKVLGVNQAINNDPILLADYFIKEDNEFHNIQLDRITGTLQEF